jgi:hypothetical protein
VESSIAWVTGYSLARELDALVDPTLLEGGERFFIDPIHIWIRHCQDQACVCCV